MPLQSVRRCPHRLLRPRDVSYVLCARLLSAYRPLSSMYDRKLKDPRPFPVPANPLRARLETLLGVTGWRMAQFRPSWTEVTSIWFRLIWRPHLLGILIFEAMLFGFGIGINVSCLPLRPFSVTEI